MRRDVRKDRDRSTTEGRKRLPHQTRPSGSKGVPPMPQQFRYLVIFGALGAAVVFVGVQIFKKTVPLAVEKSVATAVEKPSLQVAEKPSPPVAEKAAPPVAEKPAPPVAEKAAPPVVE